MSNICSYIFDLYNYRDCKIVECNLIYCITCINGISIIFVAQHKYRNPILIGRTIKKRKTANGCRRQSVKRYCFSIPLRWEQTNYTYRDVLLIRDVQSYLSQMHSSYPLSKIVLIQSYHR